MTSVAFIQNPPQLPRISGDRDVDHRNMVNYHAELGRWLQNFAQGENKTGPEWFPMTMLNSWVHYGAPYPVASYRVLPGRNVQIRGLIKNGVLGSPACAVPTALRPGFDHIFGCCSSNGTGFVSITTAGNITPFAPGVNTWYSIELIYPIGG